MQVYDACHLSASYPAKVREVQASMTMIMQAEALYEQFRILPSEDDARDRAKQKLKDAVEICDNAVERAKAALMVWEGRKEEKKRLGISNSADLATVFCQAATVRRGLLLLDISL